MYECVCPPSCALLLLAFAAAARPRHRFQTSLRDRPLADLTNPVCALPDPRQRLFDSSQKSPVSLMQLNLQLRFLIGIGLVNHISLQAPCRWHPGLSRAQGRRHLTLFLQQQIAVSLQIGLAHDLSSAGGALAYGLGFYTHTNPVSATRVRIAGLGTSQC